MTYNMSVFANQLSVGRTSEDNWVALRGLRDGAAVVVPWYQALVMEGRAFGIHAGSVTTPIAGHAAIDADQPEAAVWFADGTAGIPLYINMAMETGATTLAQAGMMCAVSNIAIGAGTSTAATPFNLNMTSTGISTGATAAVAYTGNGTDPLTAGNFLELARVSALADSDAAGNVAVYPTIRWSAQNDIAPIVQDIGSILAYGEAAANTLFATLIWAELPETALQ